MYTKRLMEAALARAQKTFPVIALCGPRQSGKSTLLANYLKESAGTFISFDDPDYRSILFEEPLEYLENLPRPVVIDEVQYAPEVTNYIKIIVDQDRTPGQWFLTGSQQFHVMKDISESLAGRVAVFNLPTFSLQEHSPGGEVGDFLLSSTYPEVALNPQVDRGIWYSSYLQTYIERDVRMLLNVADLRDFERFFRLLAARVGQELNQSRLASEVGVSVPTIKRWISVLEASFIIFLLPPYFNNFGKRIVKSPKVYFYDTAFVNYLNGIREGQTLLNGPMAGALFENAVVSEVYKNALSKGVKPELYYWRSQSGIEIDLIIGKDGGYMPCEIKLASTIKPLFYKNLTYWLKLSEQPDQKGCLITNCSRDFPLPGHIKNIFWRDVAAL